jgi:N-carbamoyl-L-amino-acid hydrolase
MKAERFAALWSSLAPIGRVPDGGGYVRYAWSEADVACREWFTEKALDRGLRMEVDGNGNLFAWWGRAEDGDAVLTGSHLDSVPRGGGYDGALGVVSALLAVDVLRERGAQPRRPIGIAVFAEEEGSRFGVACLGSRLFTGGFDPTRARALVDRNGISLARAMADAGGDPSGLGADAERLVRIGAMVELHVEQGRALADLDAAVGVASAIWPHGRWRLEFRGEANHAGTTRMADRRDPMLTAAYAVLAANKEARLRGGHATIGRMRVEPNATNAIAAQVSCWLDARAADVSTLDGLVTAITSRIEERSVRDGTEATIEVESVSPVTEFDPALRERLAAALGGSPPALPTGAGHDAGVLAAVMPTAMLFVRNPTGVSHSPAEWASDEDCAAGVVALADVLEELACRG